MQISQRVNRFAVRAVRADLPCLNLTVSLKSLFSLLFLPREITLVLTANLYTVLSQT